MVSPSKKRKDRKGRENEDRNVGVLKDKQAGHRKSAKPFKPLASKKFYLDIKNNTSLLKLEIKLKSLGATIEQFLVKEVNYVVSDRKDSHLTDNRASCSTPILSPSPSPSPSLGVSSPLDGIGQKKTKSRAEAMLERVRLQPQTVKIDPLDNARSWNIPIYSLQEILIRLEKICTKGGSSSKSQPGLKILKGHYLKLETDRTRRPEFKQLREWPTLNLNSGRGESPFTPYHDGTQRMTRKLSKDGTERLAGGYCEMCCIDFPDIKTHVLTPQHIKYINTSENYAKLDSIIKSKTVDAFIASQMCAGLAGGLRRCLRSGSVESQANSMGSRSSSLAQSNGHVLPRTRATTRSLDDSCTKKPLEVQCNGIVNHNHLTRSAVKSDSILVKELGLEYEGISRRTRTISASCPGTNSEYSQLSPTGSDITHHLRSRKQMWLPTSLLGTTAEDALNNSRMRPHRDYLTSEAMKSPGEGKGPVTLVSDENIKVGGKDEEEKFQSKSVFGFDTEKTRSQESSDDDGGSIEKQFSKNSSESLKIKEKIENQDKINFKKKSKKKNIPRELANLSYTDDKRRKVQKKRLSVEEKLIEDNKTYYKVEVLNSKLRSTGYYITQSQRELEMSRANGNDGCVTQNCTEPTKSGITVDEKEPVVVRFKKVRQTELSLLSDEAESFMFGEPSRRESSVSTESSEEDDEVSLKLDSEEPDRIVTKIKKEILDESSMGSCSITSSSTSSRRKRKTPDESILLDNAEYYKFEATGSRLRFHGNLFPPTPGADHKKGLDECPVKLEPANETKSDSKSLSPLKVKLDESDFKPENIIDDEKSLQERIDGRKPRYEDLEFSFESVPTHEPWYQTFKRQDECREAYYPRYTNYPRVLLPYEYPNSVIKRFKLAAIKAKKRKYNRKQKKMKKLIADDKPRKSPRCHASTLAIMSSLMRRRPRDSPDKKLELPSSEISQTPSEMIVDEESRCSIIIEPPSVAPPDSQMSAAQTPIPEIRIDLKPDNTADLKNAEDDIKKAEEAIDELFTEVCCDNEDDVIAQMLQAIKKEVDAAPVKESHKKGKSKKREPPIAFANVSTCLQVDPELLQEDISESIYSPGPVVDMMSLIDGYRSCSSMERADYEHMNPHAVDALRVLIAESCNSSDCGGSSACDYSFLEDGRVCKKRKRKKRNMTGWPANNKRKFVKKSEELSTVVLRRNCRVKDGLGSIKETRNEPPQGELELNEVVVKLKEEPSESQSTAQEQCFDDSDVKADSVKSDVNACSTISRTTSIDSSSIQSFDVQSCYIRVKKMTDGCVETFSRQLRSSDSSPPKNSSNRRGSSRQAKIVGRKSLKRCR